MAGLMNENAICRPPRRRTVNSIVNGLGNAAARKKSPITMDQSNRTMHVALRSSFLVTLASSSAVSSSRMFVAISPYSQLVIYVCVLLCAVKNALFPSALSWIPRDAIPK